MASSSADTFERAAKKYTPAGKTVVITGATKGIGRATLIEMARLGARVFCCARSGEDLRALLEECSVQGLDVQGEGGCIWHSDGKPHVKHLKLTL